MLSKFNSEYPKYILYLYCICMYILYAHHMQSPEGTANRGLRNPPVHMYVLYVLYSTVCTYRYVCMFIVLCICTLSK